MRAAGSGKGRAVERACVQAKGWWHGELLHVCEGVLKGRDACNISDDGGIDMHTYGW